MGLLPCLSMLLPLICYFWIWSPSIVITAQSPDSSMRQAKALDSLLQDYAYRAFVNPRTGRVYDATVPSNLSGIQVSAMRLRSGSLRTKGVQMYKEFIIPTGVIVRPYVERLVLVYQNLGNWSTVYYPPLSGYEYLAPVLGLLAYDASNLLATNLHELDIRASRQPMSINFSGMVPEGSVARCVWFDLDGLVNFSNVVSGNLCSTYQQGHFSIVVESAAPPPSPSGGENNNRRIWIIVGSVVGGLALLVLLGLLVVWVHKYKHRKKMQQMERAAEVGEALHMTTVGTTKAPAAMVTRTQPTLETEYAP